MAQKKQTILIIEDDLDVAEMLNAYFRVQEYEVLTADWGEVGIETAKTSLPNLIILDIRLPDIDGFEVAEKLRANRRTAAIPIIFLTEKRQRMDRIKGLGLGADDYITKPFDIQELKLRVRNALRRASQGGLTNTVTNLPEGQIVDERLQLLLDSPDGWSLVVARIENLDKFREVHGFVASDDALRAISVLIERSVHDLGSDEVFLGHLSATELLLVIRMTQTKALTLQLSTRLSQSIDLFYPVDVRENKSQLADQIRVRLGSIGQGQIKKAVDAEALKRILVQSIA